MNNDIIDEIERYLSKYRNSDTMKLKYLEDPVNDTAPSSCFNKTWCKLGMPEKLNRLMRYLTKVQQKLNLDAAQTEYLRKFFYDNVNVSLSSDDCVSYDPVESEIITIIGLKCDGNNFYIQQPDNKPKPEGIRVKQRVFANINQLLNASKDTPEIKEIKVLPEDVQVKIPAPPAADDVKIPIQVQAEIQTETQAAANPEQKRTVVIKKKLNPSS